MGIRTLTIVEIKGDKGDVNYLLNGDLPIDEAAKGIVIAVFNAEKIKESKRPNM